MLFADVQMTKKIIGLGNEIEPGKQTITDIIEDFEEVCHPEEQEHMSIGQPNKTRVPASNCDRHSGTQKRACFSVTRWLEELETTKTSRPESWKRLLKQQDCSTVHFTQGHTVK